MTRGRRRTTPRRRPRTTLTPPKEAPMTRHSVQTDMLELVTDTHRVDPDQLTIADALEAEPVTLRFPGFPPVQGVGPAIVAIEADQ